MGDVRGLLVEIVLGFNWVVLAYAATLALTQLMLIVVAAVHITRTMRRDVAAGGEVSTHGEILPTPSTHLPRTAPRLPDRRIGPCVGSLEEFRRR